MRQCNRSTLEDDEVAGLRRIDAGLDATVREHRDVHEEIDRLRDVDPIGDMRAHHLAQIADAARMIALDAVKPVPMLVAGRGQQVMDAAVSAISCRIGRR